MAADLSGIVIAPPTRRARLSEVYRKLKRWPVVPVFLLGLVVFAGLFAPLISPHDPETGDLRERNIPPAWSGGEQAIKTVVERVTINERTTSVTLSDALVSNPNAQIGDQVKVFTRPAGSTKFLLGTDHLGRDVLSRVIYGARISLLVSIITLAVGGSLGIAIGLAAGWYGGVVDEFLMRLVDIKLAIPLILIALVLVITLGQSLWIIVTVLCLFIWPRFARQEEARYCN
jgi:peptide/nickel transport system permease protein